MNDTSPNHHHRDLGTALLDEAAAMIAQGGVASVTMRALGRRLGVSRGAPYRHFASKEALLVAVAAAGFNRLTTRLQAVDAAAPGCGVERLRRLGEAYVRFAVEHPAHYRLMYGREALTRDEVPTLRDAAVRLFDEMVEVIRAHQKTGNIKRQDPHTQAYVAWSALHGLASLWIEGQILATDDIEGLIRQTTTTVLDGMRVQPRPA